jgi:DNA-binding ferritin-like protein
MGIFGNKNNDFMKKLDKLAALQNKAADAVTAEMIAAANAELVEAGFVGVELVGAGALAAVNAELATANTTIAQRDGTITTLNAQVEQLKGSSETVTHTETVASEKATDKIQPAMGEEKVDVNAKAHEISNQILDSY